MRDEELGIKYCSYTQKDNLVLINCTVHVN